MSERETIGRFSHAFNLLLKKVAILSLFPSRFKKDFSITSLNLATDFLGIDS